MNYGGDEIQALVLDMGTDTTRAGYAGDDAPKSVFSTSYGFTQRNVDSSDPPATDQQFHIGDNGPIVWRPNMEVRNPFANGNGVITDFDAVPQIINYALNYSLRANPEEHPILVTEPAWNTTANRERMAEILFEQFRVPAFYIANNGVLNAFAAGKGTALIVDIGKNVASALPVADGFVLRKGVIQSTLPMFLRVNARHVLQANEIPVDLTPYQLISQKQVVEANAPPRYTLRQDRLSLTTETWKAWASDREVDEWVARVAGVLEQSWSVNFAQTKQGMSYEFPSGYHTIYDHNRFLPGEIYFNQSHLDQSKGDLPPTLPTMVRQAIENCDVDRNQLLGNIVLTGGGSLLQGTADRLSNELIRTLGPKVKLHVPGNLVERRFSAWIGGSILASLGTFHQLWISQEEWQEHGRAIVGQRCK